MGKDKNSSSPHEHRQTGVEQLRYSYFAAMW